MKLLCMLLVTVFLLSSVLAEDVLDISSVSSADSIAPPPSPDQEQQFILIDQFTHQNVSNIHLEIIIQDKTEGTQTKTLRFVPRATIALQLPVQYGIIVRGDIFETPGRDYYGQSIVDDTIMLLPAGSIRGSVVMDGKAVRDARIQCYCDSAYGDIADKYADESGHFLAEYLPTGNCKIVVSTAEKTGSTTVQIVQGTMQDITVELDTSIVGKSVSPLIIIIVILILAGSLFLYSKRKRKKEEGVKGENTIQKKEVLAPTSHISKNVQNILKTLPAKEREVMQFILNNTDTYTTQAKIKNALSIPKTSLARILLNLQHKKLITIDRIGKLKKVKMEEWVEE
ncbi:MAG: hypothetical protein V1725_07150 [archaeon]